MSVNTGAGAGSGPSTGHSPRESADRAAERATGRIGVLSQRVYEALGERTTSPPVPPQGPARITGALGDRFRLPGVDDPAPGSNHLAGVCAWAALLGLGGMAVALRAFIGLMTTGGAWYAPTVITIGVAGLICTIGAFASVHRRRLPWILLGAASVALVADWIATGL